MGWLWRLLTSVRFALALIGFLILASLIGVAIPQLPLQLRDNQAATDAWLALQSEERFGSLTQPMYRLGLFEVFRSPWFVSGLFLLVASVSVCTANRITPIWRNAARPQTRVPDEYFERGQQAVQVLAAEPDALVGELRQRRYRVETYTEGGATYVFADRFPWAQMATFVSHLALILFLAAGLVTLVTSREQQIFVGEGEPGAPVFAPTDPDHMQVYVEDAIGSFDETGFPLDFRTELVVFRGGEEVARGVSTVNDPLSYAGYRFHQSAFFPDGAALQVRNLSTGRIVYDEVLALTAEAATPRLVVIDARGEVLLDDVIVPTDFIGEAAGSQIVVPGTNRQFWVGAVPRDEERGWEMIVFETTPGGTGREVLTQGQEVELGGLRFGFLEIAAVPSTTVSALPGAPQEIVVELSDGPNGTLLTVGPLAGRALALSENEPVSLDGFEYTFLGRREFSGITVRKDPGSLLVWIATGVLLVGLSLTFYLPRRRLWGKIESGQAAFRGLGGRARAVESEIRQVAAAAARGRRAQ